MSITLKLSAIALFSFFSGGVLLSLLSRNGYFIRFCLLYAIIYVGAVFIGNKYIIFMLYASFCIYVSKKQPENILYYYVVLLSAFPISVTLLLSLPGVNNLFFLNHYRVLVLALLLPAFVKALLSEERMFASPSSYTGIMDRLLFAYLFFEIILSSRDSNLTSTLRGAAHIVVDAWIPYFVISRSIKNVNNVLVVLLFTAIVISIMAILENLFLLRVYDAIISAVGDPFILRNYRAGSLRVFASMGHPLVLGFFLAVSLIIAVRVRGLISCPIYTPWILSIIIILGINATGSRSPLMTSIFGFFILVWWSMGRQFVEKTAWIVLSIFIVFFYWLFYFGVDWLVSFDRDGKSGNFYYRYELLLNSSDAIKNNLFFGSTDYLINEKLQNSVQGQGIIDVTNTYLGIILGNGLVGLFFFLGVWFVGLKGLYRVNAPDNTASILMAMCVTMMLMMFILSPVWSAPSYSWLLLAIISGFLRLYDSRS